MLYVVWGCWEMRDRCSIVAGMTAEHKQLIHISQIAAQKTLSAPDYRFVTSQTEREEGSGIAHAHKT
jgi:hypothetical protein